MPETEPPMDPESLLDLLRRTFAQSSEVIGHVRSGQLEAPTPCPAFDVRTLVGHMLFAAARVALAGQRKPVSEDGPAVTGLGDAEWAPAFDKAAAEAMAAWSSEGAMDGDIGLPFGTFPAYVVAQIYVLEQATHAWDLAGAVGARRLLDSSLARAVLPMARVVIRPEYRGEEPLPFGEVVDAGPTASPYEQLAAVMGRRLDWRATAAGDGERADLLRALAKARRFLRYTVRDVTDDQARQQTTVSTLCLGGIIKHVTRVEERWVDFIEEGPSAIGQMSEQAMAAHAATFVTGPDDTVEDILDRYQQVGDRTDAVVSTLASLDASQPLPEAPWFEKGARWSARTVLLHVLEETAQHAGHADIVRESLDGAKTMG